MGYGLLVVCLKKPGVKAGLFYSLFFFVLLLIRSACAVYLRFFDFDKRNGQWIVNGRPLSCDEVRFTMKRNSTEKWIYETGGGWSHPIHHHFVEGRILSRNGVAITADSQEFSRKDVVWLGENDKVEFTLKATDYRGVYPMHCHNVVHEDHAMMLLFAVEDVGDTNPNP